MTLIDRLNEELEIIRQSAKKDDDISVKVSEMASRIMKSAEDNISSRGDPFAQIVEYVNAKFALIGQNMNAINDNVMMLTAAVAVLSKGSVAHATSECNCPSCKKPIMH